MAPFFSTHEMQPPEKGPEPDTAVKHLKRFRRSFGPDGRVPQSALFVAIRYLCRGNGWLKSLPEERWQPIVTFSKVATGQEFFSGSELTCLHRTKA